MPWNHHQIPVNAPKCPFHNSFHRDGAMRTDGNLGSKLNYEPNREGAFVQDRLGEEPPHKLNGMATHHGHRVGTDYHSQAGALFRLFDEGKRQRLFATIAGGLSQVPEDIQCAQIEHFTQADQAYGAGVKHAFNLA